MHARTEYEGSEINYLCVTVTDIGFNSLYWFCTSLGEATGRNSIDFERVNAVTYDLSFYGNRHESLT